MFVLVVKSNFMLHRGRVNIIFLRVMNIDFVRTTAITFIRNDDDTIDGNLSTLQTQPGSFYFE